MLNASNWLIQTNAKCVFSPSRQHVWSHVQSGAEAKKIVNCHLQLLLRPIRLASILCTANAFARAAGAGTTVFLTTAATA